MELSRARLSPLSPLSPPVSLEIASSDDESDQSLEIIVSPPPTQLPPVPDFQDIWGEDMAPPMAHVYKAVPMPSLSAEVATLVATVEPVDHAEHKAARVEESKKRRLNCQKENKSGQDRSVPVKKRPMKHPERPKKIRRPEPHLPAWIVSGLAQSDINGTAEDIVLAAAQELDPNADANQGATVKTSNQRGTRIMQLVDNNRAVVQVVDTQFGCNSDKIMQVLLSLYKKGAHKQYLQNAKKTLLFFAQREATVQ